MDWNQVEARWKQARGKIKEKWVRLTDEDLEIIGGQRGRLEHKIHERYGFAADHVRKEIDDWVRCLPVSSARRNRKSNFALSMRRRQQSRTDWSVTALLCPTTTNRRSRG